MTMDADMDMGTTTTTIMRTSTLMLVTHIHPITMLISQTST